MISHAEFLRRVTLDDSLVQALQEDIERAPSRTSRHSFPASGRSARSAHRSWPSCSMAKLSRRGPHRTGSGSRRRLWLVSRAERLQEPALILFLTTADRKRGRCHRLTRNLPQRPGARGTKGEGSPALILINSSQRW